MAHEVHPAAKTPSIPPAGRLAEAAEATVYAAPAVPGSDIGDEAARGSAHRHMAAKRSPWRLKAPGQPVIGLLGHVLLPPRYSRPAASPPCGVLRIEAVEDVVRSDRRFNGVEERLGQVGCPGGYGHRGGW